MKKVHEYDFSFQTNETFEDAIQELTRAKDYLNQSMNGTIKNIGDLYLDMEEDKLIVKFMLDGSIVIEEDYSLDYIFDWFLDWNAGPEDLKSCKTLKANLLKQLEKLENHIKKEENQ